MHVHDVMPLRDRTTSWAWRETDERVVEALGCPHTHPEPHSTIMCGQAPKTCLLSKSQFWSNATENVKNQLPIGFGSGDFSRD